MKNTRREKDSIGELDVPSDVYWGINTQRALLSFKISGKPFPKEFIIALAQVKKACLIANVAAKKIDKKIGDALEQAVDEIITEGKFLDQFPIDVFQTGSGTQTNVNMNEVLSNRANEILGQLKGTKTPVHPNDHANASQSSNDVIPTAMHVAAAFGFHDELMVSLELLRTALEDKIGEFDGIVKVGRTHLMDAVPIPLSTEFKVYKQQIETSLSWDLGPVWETLLDVPIGGTALGTGLNTPTGFTDRVIKELRKITGFKFTANPVPAEGISSHIAIVRASAALRSLALTCMKMANDIRWMGSGPRAGLGELLLPENEPGSSIMPGKVNPTQSEALIQVCVQVIGNDTAIASAESQGSILDLNMSKPVMIVNLLESMKILSTAIESFTENCLKGLKVNKAKINQQLGQSLMLATRLAPVIGYDQAAEVAKKAHKEGKTIRQVIHEEKIKIENLDELLDPSNMV